MREHVQCEVWHRGGRNIDRWWWWWWCRYCNSGVIDAEHVKIVAVLPIDCWMMIVGEMPEKKSDGGDGGESI